MKKDLVILGAGGFGREILWLLESNEKEEQKYHILGFIDDNLYEKENLINGLPVIGNIEMLMRYNKPICVVIAIGNSFARRVISERLQSNKYISFPTVIGNGVQMSRLVKVGKGCIFCANNIITVNIKIGDFFIGNLNCTIGHDVIVDDYVTLYPNVNISGNVCIGKVTEIGTGVQIIQGKVIGSNCTIGAGAVVVENIPANKVAVGIPAKIIKSKE